MGGVKLINGICLGQDTDTILATNIGHPLPQVQMYHLLIEVFRKLMPLQSAF